MENLRFHGEQSKFCLNMDSENMETSNTEAGSLCTGGPDRDINPEEEMFKKRAVVAGEGFEIPKINCVDDDNDKGSRTVQRETCFGIGDDLDENCIKELSSTLKIPDFEALGENEKSHSMKSCLKVQSPEESVTLQGARLTGLDAVKTEFHLNNEGTKLKELLSQMDFSGNLSNSWDQGTHSKLPIIPDLKEEKELFSFHLPACNEQVTGKRVGETHASDRVSNEEQSEQSAVTLNVVNQNKVSSESEVRVSGEGSSYSRSPYVREIKAKETYFREKMIVSGGPSESPKQNCDNDERGSRTILIKPCYVVLKGLRDELKEKCEDSLISLDIETQSIKMQNETKASFSDLFQVSLHDVLDKNNVKKQNRIIKIQNSKALLENEKLNNTEKKEIKSPEEAVTSRGSNSMDTKIHHNSEETQGEGSFTQMDTPDLSDMIEEGIFSRLSLVEKEYKSSTINLSNVEDEGSRAKRLQSGSCPLSNMAPKVQKEKSREEEEGPLVHQSHGVQIVYYKMSGPVVGLLGVPSKACKPRRLQRLVELEDSSDDETCVCCRTPKKMSRPVLGVSSSKACKPCKMRRVEELEDLSEDIYDDFQVTQEIEDSDYHPTLYKKEMKQLLKPYAAHVLWQKPLNSHYSHEKKRRGRRPTSKEASASVHGLQLSEEQSRIKVIDSLRGMLQKRLEESPDLDVHEDTILRLANDVEKEIFNLFLCVDQRYKNKYRSLLFNLKAPKNKLLFHQVVLGEVSPQCLVQMNSLELAPKELAEWRAKESKHVLEVIEKQQREPPRSCPTKLTHKGEIEIHREVDEDFTLEDLYGSALCMDKKPISQPAAEAKRDTTDQHRSHLLDLDCLICTGRMAPDGERRFNPPQSKPTSKKKAEDSSRRLHSTSVYSDKERKHLEKDRPASTGVLKKSPRLQKQVKDTVLWEGFIQMFSIKQFAAKAFPVSGYGTCLIQALPELIQSRGCILPEDVWDYLESIWPAEAKEISMIRFCPAMTKDFSTYNMLYSYLNNKQRYGIVDSNQMEMFMVPLPAFQPVPAKFHPLGGPGLDANHSCLMLGLILPKKVSGDPSTSSTGPSLLRETKRKTVTFKNNLVTRCFSPPLDSSGSTKLAEPFQQVNHGPLSSCSLCSHECGGNVALDANVLGIQQLSSILYPGVASSGGVSQVPAVPHLVSNEPSATSDLQNHTATGDSNPTIPVEEALSLIQHLEALVQLNSQIQNQTLFPLPSLDLSAILQATAPGESQIVGGSTFPPVQQESGVYLQSQLTLPPFCGPVYPPSGC
ncbi:SPOC domain-containing protein 1 isoform X1 [Trachemys scripta elegans]|uniref:SPOC domain-containing protein 1 isoform X1 n=1 Tax=Trachemys scripta elegans TaxID=31138 RepID=UPI00155790C9|nr:SPOC domain-containing protein 1 isoform X1 [Trachemys scripta elegans]XP_034610227.1 SPOC domain-containing protein 1 isoform X1 [Trachemys scripta elegans]